MRTLTATSAAAVAALALALALALAACQPAADTSTEAKPQAPIESTSAPAVGGPSELPKDGGVTPAPDAMAGASAEDVGAAVSPAEAAVLSGGEQKKQ